jgi:GntR family transcriptional regulator, transcriptional repressor for pyruvate dehydrogenase complex
MSLFTPVKSQRLYEQIVDQIIDLIQQQEFSPGSQLPPERDLAQQLQVSRASLREALTALQMMGLVETRSGQGTFVSDGAASAFLRFDPSWLYEGEESPFAILQARKVVEPPIAAFATRHCSEDDLDRVRGIQGLVDAEKLDRQVFSEGDRKFHLTIAEISGNPVLATMMSIVYELMGQKLWLSLRDATLSSMERVQEYADQHWAIYKAIESRDPDGAYNAMKVHLETVEQFMVDSDMVPGRMREA